MCSIYVKHFLKLPPIRFPECLDELNGAKLITDEIYYLLGNIIDNKKSQCEKYPVDNIGVLDKFIEEQLKVDEAPVKRHYTMPNYFNDVITPIIHSQNINNTSEVENAEHN